MASFIGDLKNGAESAPLLLVQRALPANFASYVVRLPCAQHDLHRGLVITPPEGGTGVTYLCGDSWLAADITAADAERGLRGQTVAGVHPQRLAAAETSPSQVASLLSFGTVAAELDSKREQLLSQRMPATAQVPSRVSQGRPEARALSDQNLADAVKLRARRAHRRFWVSIISFAILVLLAFSMVNPAWAVALGLGSFAMFVYSAVQRFSFERARLKLRQLVR